MSDLYILGGIIKTTCTSSAETWNGASGWIFRVTVSATLDVTVVSTTPLLNDNNC